MSARIAALDDLAGSEIIDSRDIVAALADFDELEADERTEELIALAEQAREMADAGIPDWPYGETLIREDYFEEYARELADDIGATNADHGWPLTFIDWTAAADALKVDYLDLEFGGYTYYARA